MNANFLYRSKIVLIAGLAMAWWFGIVSDPHPAQAQEAPAGVSADAQKTLTWKTVVNVADSIPGTTTPFNSFNQPSINNRGLVVFRARSKGPSQPIRGIFERDITRANAPITTVADVNSAVPDPNNTGATFNEMPAFPRVPTGSDAVAFRGVSQPVWEYTLPDGTDTKIGASGVYMVNVFKQKTLITAASQLGSRQGSIIFRFPAPALPERNSISFPERRRPLTARSFSRAITRTTISRRPGSTFATSATRPSPRRWC